MADSILLERDGGVARIILNRPDMGNALDMPMAQALLQTVIACDEDPSVRCVLLTGAGRMFCAGGDVASFAAAGEQLTLMLEEITGYVHAAVARLARMEKPVVTAINGAAAGAGIGLALIGDIALADPRAHFTLAYTGIGLSPDGGTTWLLPRLIGLRRTQELCLRNRRVGAEEAQAIGMITRRAAEDSLFEEATALAQELARGPTPAFGVMRRLLLDSATTPLEAQLQAEGQGIAAMGGTTEGKEGIAAFLEKRTPDFTKGR